jgi:hypothetical protein
MRPWVLLATVAILAGCSPDEVRLEVVLSSPENLSYANDKVEFRVSAVGGKPDSYELLKDGNPVASFKGSFYSFDTASTPEGRYTFKVRATYRARLFESEARTITIDKTTPTLTVTPSNGTTGLRSDTPIAVRFSEPMDKARVEAAYKSDTLPLETVTLRWNDSATELSITPKQTLEYALETAKSYSFTLSSGARDLAGNPITSTSTTFKTLRRKARMLEPEKPPTDFRDGEAGLVVGTLATPTAQAQYLSFDLSDIPDNPIPTDLLSATFRTLQTGCVGSPYEVLGGLRLESVAFAGQAIPDGSAVTLLLELGLLSSQATAQSYSRNVLEAFRDDWINRSSRSGRSKYRLRFEKDTASPNHNCTFKASRSTRDTVLEIQYLTP